MLLDEKIRAALGAQPLKTNPLGGGCFAQVYHVLLSDGRDIVVKHDQNENPKLDTEAWMLRYLSLVSSLPVPEVLYDSPELLIMNYIRGASLFPPPAQEHAADLLLTLHGIQGQAFGFERDTLIGGLKQSNPWTKSWVAFFRDHRIVHMAAQARDAGRLPASTQRRIEIFAARLDDFIGEPPYPALLHGDLWSGNVLSEGLRIGAFLDPALYFGHPEMELAFITLFNTFGDSFFSRYNDVRPIAKGFFEVRRDIYNLYPLLVHVRLYGAAYLSGVERCLVKFGF